MQPLSLVSIADLVLQLIINSTTKQDADMIVSTTTMMALKSLMAHPIPLPMTITLTGKNTSLIIIIDIIITMTVDNVNTPPAPILE